MRLLLLPALSLLLAACATAPEPVSPEAPEATRRDPQQATPAVTVPEPAGGATTAVDALLEEARDLRRAGDLSASLGRLERALRLAPQRADVYLELARSHLATGNSERAAASAERGLLYCRGSTCRKLRGFLGG